MPDESPDDFGWKLRQARERRGVSLRQIANATKISIGVLEALERNDISRLPGGIFSRAFVRSYAAEVGLDPEETIQDFIAHFPHDSVTAGHHPSKQVEDNEAIEGNRRTAATFVRLIALSVPIAGVVLYFASAGRRAPAPPAPPPQAAVAASRPAPVSPPREGAASDSATARPVAALDRLVVNVSATRPCWISATVDGERVIERVLQPGEQRTFEGHREVVLNVGDAGAIVMTLNGADARPLGRAGEVVKRRLTLANFREYLVAQ